MPSKIQAAPDYVSEDEKAHPGNGKSFLINETVLLNRGRPQTHELGATLAGSCYALTGATRMSPLHFNTLLTNSPNRANFSFTGKRHRESHLSRKDETMKLTLRACRAVTHAHQIHTPIARRPLGAEEQPGTDREANGRIGVARRRSALEKVHQSESRQRASNEPANALHNDGSVGARRGDARENSQQDARSGRIDRAGQRVTAGGAFAAAIPNTLTRSTDPFDLVPSAWRNGRQSKPAVTVTPDLFELAGIRAAEHWLKVRPTARPNQWCRSTFDSLVAGLGRIPSYADCCAAFERAFKRRVSAASRTDNEAAEVRA